MPMDGPTNPGLAPSTRAACPGFVQQADFGPSDSGSYKRRDCEPKIQSAEPGSALKVPGWQAQGEFACERRPG